MITNQPRNDELKRLTQIYSRSTLPGAKQPQTTRPQSKRITQNQPVSAFGTSNNRYGLSQTTQSQPKRFQSRYIKNDGKWTQNAVNDGFVEFNDYINDIKDDYKGISFNGKTMQKNGINDYKAVSLSDTDNTKSREAALHDYQMNENYIGPEEANLFVDFAKKVFTKGTLTKIFPPGIIPQVIEILLDPTTVYAPGLDDSEFYD